MAATIGFMIGYIVGIFFSNVINSGTPGPVSMAWVQLSALLGSPTSRTAESKHRR
jgi:hypothetical protein